MKVSRNNDLLTRAAKKVYPVSEGEQRCAIERRMMTALRERVKERIKQHIYTTEDGMILPLN